MSLNNVKTNRHSCVFEFINTMHPDDELRCAIENVFEGNFMSPEEDADMICGCFIQDKQQISKLKSIIKDKNFQINTFKENKINYEIEIYELERKNETKILIIVVLVVAILVMIPLLAIFNP